MKLRIFTLTIALLFFLPLVHAQVQGASFEIGSTQDSVELCNCDETIDTLVISNTGQFQTTYTISTNQPGKINPSQNQVTIQARESKEIPIVVGGSCGEPTETVDYTISVQSNLGGTKTLTRPLRTIQCQTIDATLFAPNQTIQPCEEFNYSLHVTNPSTFTETYNFSTDQDAINITNTTRTIQPGQTIEQNATASYTCGVSGDRDVSFTIRGEKSGLQTTLTHDLTIEDDYNYSIDTRNMSVCRDVMTERQFSITNNMHFNNTYDLRLQENPDEITLEDKTIQVQPGQTRNITLSINDFEDPEEGEYTIIAVSRLGNVVKEKTINYETRNCYDLSLEFTTRKDVCPGRQTYEAEITNNGEEQDITLLSDQDVSPNQVTLANGETETITLEFTNNVQQGIETRTLTITPRFDANVTEDFSIQQSIREYSENECSRPSITTDETVSFTETNQTVTIRNEGIKPTRYAVSFSDLPDFAEAEDDIVTVEPGQRKNIAYSLSADREDIGTYGYVITLRSISNNQTYEEQQSLIITDQGFMSKVSTWVQTNSCGPVTAGATVLFLLILIGSIAMRFTSKEYNKGKIGGLLLMATSLAILVTLLVAGPPAFQPTPNYMQVDGETQIDLETVFSNTTNASYTASETGFDIEIDDTTATITGDASQETVRFTMTEDNQSQVSEEYILSTQPQPTLIEQNCPWIILVILLLTLLSFLFLPGENEEDVSVTKPEDLDKLDLESEEKEESDEEPKPTEDPETSEQEESETPENPLDKPPNSNNTKAEMKAWLDYRGVEYDDDMLKDEIYEVVKEEKENINKD